MKAFVKPALVLAMAGALALGAMTPSEARGGRALVGAGIGLAAGAIIAGAAANSGYYGPGYGAYAYDPGYAYGGDAYYAPAPVYVEPTYAYPGSDNERYQPGYGGYNSNYNGPLHERTLQGRDY